VPENIFEGPGNAVRAQHITLGLMSTAHCKAFSGVSFLEAVYSVHIDHRSGSKSMEFSYAVFYALFVSNPHIRRCLIKRFPALNEGCRFSYKSGEGIILVPVLV
jgi:hypothetical protein